MLVRIKMIPEHPPSSWPQERYANIDGTELFVYRLGTGILKLLDASRIEPPQRDVVRHAIIQLLMEGFIPAFSELGKIKGLVSPPEMDRRQAYENFMGTLWQGYKNFLPKATREMGFDTGFIFQSDSKFEAGIGRFVTTHPAVPKDFGRFLQQQRARWQGELSHVRNNYVDHRNVEWDDVKKLYCIDQAERFFDSAWTAAEDILGCLICSRLPPQIGVREIPVAQRNPSFPDRFGFYIRQPMKGIEPVPKS